MTRILSSKLTRRTLLTGSAALIAAPALALGATQEKPVTVVTAKRNISSFTLRRWQDHFDNLKNGAILADIESRSLMFWSEDGKTTRLYPTSIPLTEQLTKRGRTRIVRKVIGPSWRPTAAMKRRNPEWPDYVGPGPDNPLGTHALYLSWTYYRIHGTNDTRKIGRRSSNGCIGLYNEQIADLYGLTKIGTQVILL
ncbi:MAG: L,D-transpeptidase [Alphaproteobacteria bacterium]|nr:L,D-transpeptidase [Alphaproteobacteria bacterium]